MTARTRRPGTGSSKATGTAVNPSGPGEIAPGVDSTDGPDAGDSSTDVSIITDVPPAGVPAPPEPASSARTAADIAAQRRAQLDPTPPVPGAGAAPVAGATGDTVIASATTRARFAGDGSPGRPTGGVWSDRPMVLQIQPGAPLGQTAHASDYVIAECDASEQTVMPGQQTAVCRKVWTRGQLVYRPFYDAVLAEHAARVEVGEEGEPIPAELPEGRTEMPADVIADPADPTGQTPITETVVETPAGTVPLGNIAVSDPDAPPADAPPADAPPADAPPADAPPADAGEASAPTPGETSTPSE